MDRTQKRWLVFSVGISVAVLVLMLVLTFDAETLTALENYNLRYLALGFGLHILALLVWALRIQLMCRSLNYRVPFLHSLNLVSANLLVAALTPSQIGGEAVRVYELYKAGVKTADATAVVLMERVFDGIVLGIGTVIGVYLLGKMFGHMDLPYIYMGIAYFATAVFAGLLIGFAVLVKRPCWTKVLVKKISSLFTKRWDSQRIDVFFQKIDVTIDQFYETIAHFGGRSKLGLGLGLLMTVFFWAAEFLIASVLMAGLGLAPNIVISLIFQLIIAMIMMIPLTPGGAGVAEASIFAFYVLIIPLSLIGVFILLWRLILYYFNIAAGLIASLIIVRREARDAGDHGGKKEGDCR
jgi:uncharacterized protein (TIRG00374 family)